MTAPQPPIATDVPRTRMEAASQRQRRYFTGDPCPAGHVADRYTANGYCVECQRVVNRQNRALVRALLTGAFQ